jgi:hypothetical protein
MLISEKQHQANRQNAQHSSGPKTAAGKAASSLNAVTFGLRARALLLDTENWEDYQQLCAALEAEWQPQTATERFYLETMSTSHWLLARADESEQRIYREQLRVDIECALLGRVATRRTRLERSYTAAMRELRQLQNQRQTGPQPDQQPQPPVQSKPAKPADPPQSTPPAYMMADTAQDHPAFCAPATADTR